MGLQVGIIADDLSGGNSVGYEFSSLAFHTCLIQQLDGLEEIQADVIVYDTETRLDSTELAFQKVKEVAGKFRAPVMIKKMDSLLRGSFGMEIKAIMEQQGHSHILVLPASPKAGRTTVNGYQLVNGQLLVDQKSTDPSSLVEESHVPSLLLRNFEDVGLLSMDSIIKGSEIVTKDLAVLLKRFPVIVADATSQEHLNLVVEAAYSLGIRLFAGTYGIGEAIGRMVGTKQATRKPVLTVIGSLSEMAQRQVHYAQQDPHVRVIPIHFHPFTQLDYEQVIAHYQKEIVQAVNDGWDIIVQTAPSKEEVDKLYRLADQEKMSTRELDRFLARIIQGLILPVLPAVHGLVLTGGATAQAVFEVAASTGVRILPYEVVPSAPAARLMNGPYDGLLFLTKPGSYGEESAIFELISYARLQGG
jgi:D-threonate/D-erythronate kinase